MGWGIALAALGLALMAGLWPLGFARLGAEHPYPLRFGPWMLIGLISLFIGLALLIIYLVIRKEEGGTPATSKVSLASSERSDPPLEPLELSEREVEGAVLD